ncbi:MAG: hypothetical protein ABJE95_21850 [Byssovorax sp.]
MTALRALVAALFAAAATTLAGAALTACATEAPASTDPCAKAIARLTEECKFTVEGDDGGAPLNCTGEAACAADCLYSSPCDEIKHNGPTFSGCIKACAP